MNISYVGIDYSQIEMRIAAHESMDPVLVAVFMAGEDIHLSTACNMFQLPPEKIDDKKHRYPAKRTGFGVLYGISAPGLLDVFYHDGVTHFTERDCQNFIDGWFDTYKGVKKWINDTQASMRRKGYVEDMFGRKRWIPEIRSTLSYVRDAGLRQGVNAPIQSGAQGVIKEAMGQLVPYVRVWQESGIHCKTVLQVHDELIWEMEDEFAANIVPGFMDVMANAVELVVPVKVDVEAGKNWGSMKEVDMEYFHKLRKGVVA